MRVWIKAVVLRTLLGSFVFMLITLLALSVGWILAVLFAAAAAIALTTLLFGLAVLARIVGRSRIAARRRIRARTGIEVLETVTIGGLAQWIQLRGVDRRKPVVLFLHGGPGAAEMALSHAVQDPWEQHFVCVQWDQRGAGKTFRLHDLERVRPTLTLETMVSDACEVIAHLRDRLGVERIILHGHSWGSALGTMTAKRCPENLHAFVGEGQVISMLLNEQVSYDYTLAEARRLGIRRAEEDLLQIGRPPYPPGKYMQSATVQRKWLAKFGGGGTRRHGFGGRRFSVAFGPMLLSPDYTYADCARYLDALAFTGTAFTTGRAEYLNFDLRKFGPDFQIPVFFFCGRWDYVTPSPVAADYFATIRCPHKELVWFEQSAHSPQREEPARYLEEFLERVAPFARAGAGEVEARPVSAEH